jgi:hypothetical protein
MFSPVASVWMLQRSLDMRFLLPIDGFWVSPSGG